ncbi:MAG TPA: hypothetical protein VN324_00875 [Quisquiliibacterium sp.]|nr:hypothetical protein [Quisquiliibacterium sp.]
MHSPAPTVKVRKPGSPRGWHRIAAEKFDPAVHELVEDAPAVERSPEPTKRAGQRRKPL